MHPRPHIFFEAFYFNPQFPKEVEHCEKLQMGTTEARRDSFLKQNVNDKCETRSRTERCVLSVSSTIENIQNF